jgi:hypothetical protein
MSDFYETSYEHDDLRGHHSIIYLPTTRHNIYEMGVVTESMTTLRLYITTGLCKVSKCFKAIFLLDIEQQGSLARIYSRCRSNGDNQLELRTINLCSEIEHKCTQYHGLYHKMRYVKNYRRSDYAYLGGYIRHV